VIERVITIETAYSAEDVDRDRQDGLLLRETSGRTGPEWRADEGSVRRCGESG
jgi:hypothetical protein